MKEKIEKFVAEAREGGRDVPHVIVDLALLIAEEIDAMFATRDVVNDAAALAALDERKMLK